MSDFTCNSAMYNEMHEHMRDLSLHVVDILKIKKNHLRVLKLLWKYFEIFTKKELWCWGKIFFDIYN